MDLANYADDVEYQSLKTACVDDIKLIVNASSSAVGKWHQAGYLSVKNITSMKEEGVTSWFVTNFSMILIKRQMLSSNGTFNSRIKVMHQSYGNNGASCRQQKCGFMDCTIYYQYGAGESKHPFINGSKCIFPMVFMEFTKSTTKSTEDKQPQSSLYANYLFRQMNPQMDKFDLFPPLLGVTFSETDFIIKLYYLSSSTTTKENVEAVRIAEIVLYRGEMNGDFLEHLISISLEFVDIIAKILRDMKLNDRRSSEAWKLVPNRNVFHYENFIYKAFDYRFITGRRGIYEADRRQYSMYKYSKLQPEVILQYQHSDDALDSLHIIRYNYVEGNSTPTYVQHWFDIMVELNSLHKQGIVFGDIRLSNMIFKPVDDEQAVSSFTACLIDFDLAGVENERTYPPGYNHDIDDGIRHNEAVGKALLKKQHDCFSLASIMCKFEIDIPTREQQFYHQHDWESICSLVENNDLEGGIQEIQKLRRFKLKSYNLSPGEIRAGKGTG